MRINYNVSSIIARNALNNNDTRLSNSIQRLSSGLKINNAADDSAGLAISIRMNAQIKKLEQANQNANDGISIVNTTDGAMSEVHDILQRMNELAIQSANGTNADTDREQIQLEIDELIEEIDRIAQTTEFNAQKLLDGSFAYKGYTNTENVKIKSYSDQVVSGTYAIKSINYSHFENKVKDYQAYVEKSAEGKVKNTEEYKVTSPDDIKNNLVTTTSTIGRKAFPDDCRVSLDEEDIVIKSETGFEVKLSVNDKGKIGGNHNVTTTITTPKYYTTDSYRNIAVTSQDGTKKYNIRELNVQIEMDKDGNKIANGNNAVYSGSKEEGLRNLNEDLKEAFYEKYPDAKDINVTSCTISNTTARTIHYDKKDYDIYDTKIEVEIEVKDKNGNLLPKEKMSFTVNVPLENSIGMTKDEADKAYAKYQAELPKAVQENTINKYLDTHTDTVETQFTVGKESDPILLNFTGVGAMQLQVGANEGQILEIEIPCLQASFLGVDKLDIRTEKTATESIDVVAKAINQLSGIRAKIGAYANRIEHTITNLDTTTENMTAAYSRIMDVDMATEMTEYSTVQVLVQSSTSMLAQANERPQSVLQLLK